MSMRPFKEEFNNDMMLNNVSPIKRQNSFSE